MPTLPLVYSRRRLSLWLERAGCELTWVHAPAGSGKTTLVADHLTARGVPTLWYRLDERDADPATLFYYLRAAAQKFWPEACRELAALTPEYLQGLPTYALNFFDVLLAHLPRPVAIVLDNYQELPQLSRLHSVLADALQEALQVHAGNVDTGGEPRVNVYVISRERPLEPFESLRHMGMMAVLGPDELRLSMAEAKGIVERHTGQPLADAVLQRLYEQVQGWAAGWILLLQSPQWQTQVSELPYVVRETFFEYFASELFERASPATQSVLLRASLLPHVPVAFLQHLGDSADAAGVLEDLERRNYFTTRLSGAEPAYQFHPLFRTFLRARAQRMLSSADRRSLQRRAASHLRASQQHDEAAELMIESVDWTGLSSLVKAEAARLLEQGRIGTIEQWIRAAPEEFTAADPWLLLWFGACRQPFHQADALDHFQRSYQLFRAAGDAQGSYRAWAGAAETIVLGFDQMVEANEWMTRLRELDRDFPLENYPDVEVRVASAAAMIGHATSAPASETLGWVERVERFIDETPDAGRADRFLSALVMIYGLMGWIDRLPAAARRLQRRMETKSDATVLERMRGYLSLVGAYGICFFSAIDEPPDQRQMDAWNKAGRDLMATTGLALGKSIFAFHELFPCQLMNDHAGAADALTRLSAQTFSGHRRMLAFYLTRLMQEPWIRGDLDAAQAVAEKAIALCSEICSPFVLALARVDFALLLTERGKLENAMVLLEQAAHYADLNRNQVVRSRADLALAFVALRLNDSKTCESILQSAMATGRALNYLVGSGTSPRILVPLCEFALVHGIEVDYVRLLIDSLRLRPRDAGREVDEWPWPVRIRTFGEFRLEVGGTELILTGRTQLKPIELLRTLCTAPGRHASQAELADLLWPESDGDAALNALGVTMHRARKLLGVDAALHLVNGRLGFDPDHVWIDLAAFESAVRDVDESSLQSASAGELLRQRDRLLRLARGPFMNDVDDTPWIVMTRSRCVEALLRALQRIAERLEARQDWASAIETAELALQVEPASEGLHQVLLRSRTVLGRASQAEASHASD